MKFEIDKIIRTKPQAGNYIMDGPLMQAVQLALQFDQPLLLTGAPGTGKTKLAEHVAYLLHQQTEGKKITFRPEVLRFNTKTTSEAKDIFYQYDAISHFQYTNIARLGDGDNTAKTAFDFIELKALGKAMAATHKVSEAKLLGQANNTKNTPQSTVVLIDEIDKAPRDFTNDLLNEIEEKEFFIPELNRIKISMDGNGKQRVLIIMTSNSEKNLPDAFLRRCIFYHIPSPDEAKMKRILLSHLNDGNLDQEIPESLDKRLDELIALFDEIKGKATTKEPATSELVAFAKLMGKDDLADTSKDLVALMKTNLSVLIKTEEDWKRVEQHLETKMSATK